MRPRLCRKQFVLIQGVLNGVNYQRPGKFLCWLPQNKTIIGERKVWVAIRYIFMDIELAS